jgi:hypothetical protein
MPEGEEATPWSIMRAVMQAVLVASSHAVLFPAAVVACRRICGEVTLSAYRRSRASGEISPLLSPTSSMNPADTWLASSEAVASIGHFIIMCNLAYVGEFVRRSR